ncbi:hypothetical protein [Ralstonia phage RSF1]|uniref:Uncharacterized protein n=1 Tax=Ralstonia phage RSF1 TaxID=1689679 RepID=A0A0K2QQZ1_9CAUD|nr:hypothetical protein AVU11_gp217 [Ralstonia phage RSF1]BAS05009.1 hypothetical protein [Ralstonia phage RSF1]
MRDKIIDYYKILLDLGWMVADEDGYVSVKLGDQLMPATINGKRVFLPTREQMKNKNWDNRVGFHPLRESFNLGISDMVASLRDQYVQRLNASIAYFMKELIAIAYDQDNQKNLTTEQAQVLNALSKCDHTLVKDFESIQKNTKSRNNADMFINIFIKRGGVVKGTTYGRAGIVTFPIYEALKKPEKEPINGVKLSNKNREMLIKLFEFIFPNLASDPEFFNVGINSRSAPFIESLVRATLNVVDALVESAQPYMDKVDLPEILQFPEEIGIWKEIFDSKDMVEKLARTIPALNANEHGEEMDREKEDDRRREERDMGRAEEVRERGRLGAAREERPSQPPAPRGRMILGAPAPKSTGESLGKALPDRTHEASGTDRAVTSEREARSIADRERRELERRERELREREERLERERREEEERELRERRRERDYDDRRARDRDYDRRDRERDRDYDRRDRDYDRDDRRRERSGDVFEDNPALRSALRDEEDREYRGRRGSRYDRDDRDYDRDGRRRGIRDLRDRGSRDRDYDRDDRYDRRDRYYRR